MSLSNKWLDRSLWFDWMWSWAEMLPTSGSTTVYLVLGLLKFTTDKRSPDNGGDKQPRPKLLWSTKRERERERAEEKKIRWKNREHEIRLITYIPLDCELFMQGGCVCKYLFTYLSQCTHVPDSATRSVFCQQSALISLSCDECEVTAEFALPASYLHDFDQMAEGCWVTG